MPIKVRCSTCGARLKAPDRAAGRPLDCPHCAQVVTVPPQAAAPPPAVAGPGESSDVEGRPGGRQSESVRQYFDHLADEFEDRRHHRLEAVTTEDATEADRIGAAALGLGVVAAACLAMGCFTCGLTYWAAAPVAAAGTACAAFSQSRLRLPGLAFNLLVLIPAVVAFRAAWSAAGMPESQPQPFVR
jgi:hypothetical protein